MAPVDVETVNVAVDATEGQSVVKTKPCWELFGTMVAGASGILPLICSQGEMKTFIIN
jgi:hypothetical protein